MQLMNIENTKLSEQDYMEIIYRKTAILFEASAKIGGVTSACEVNVINDLRKYGYHFGIAYQLRNDFLDYFGSRSETGKNLTEDLIEGKVTLPIIHSLENCTSEDRSVIEEAIVGENSSNQSDEIISILKKNKSDIYLKDKINEQTDLALSSLDKIPTCNYVELLKNIAEMCRSRDK